MITISKNGKPVAKYNPDSNTVKTEDKQIADYIKNGVSLLGSSEESDYKKGFCADAIIKHLPTERHFYLFLFDRLRLDGYRVDAEGIKELRKHLAQQKSEK